MLSQNDLQAISTLVRTEIAASEERMMGRMGRSIAASEERMMGRMGRSIAASEARMAERIERSENRIMAYIESGVKKEIRQIADGHTQLAEKMGRMERKLDAVRDDAEEIKGELAAQELAVTRRLRAE